MSLRSDQYIRLDANSASSGRVKRFGACWMQRDDTSSARWFGVRSTRNPSKTDRQVADDDAVVRAEGPPRDDFQRRISSLTQTWSIRRNGVSFVIVLPQP